MYDSGDADSGTAPDPSASTAQSQASPSSQLSEAWDSLRNQLSNRGVQFAIRYDGEGFVDLSGGLRRGATYLANVNLQLTVDAQRLIGWPGATAFVYGLGVYGGQSSTFVGDAQGVSNIEAPPVSRIEEAWIQQNLFANRFSMLVGRYDLNSEFYRLQSASLFLNSSFGVGPKFSQSGQEGPSIFPYTSVALASRSNRSKRLSFGRLCLTECRWIDQTERGRYSRRVMACSWLRKRRICTGLLAQSSRAPGSSALAEIAAALIQASSPSEPGITRRHSTI